MIKLIFKKEKIDIFILYALSVVIIVLVSIGQHAKEYLNSKKSKQSSVVVAEPKQQDFYNKALFNDIKIEGKAFVIYDITTHEIIAAKNETQKLPLASITKVMTAVSATLHGKRTDTVIIKQKNIEDGFDLGLKNNQSWKLDELLKYTLVFSSNDGAASVADAYGGSEEFISQMNTDAKSLGLDLVFTDPAGRDMRGNIGGLGSALDAAKLFSIARKNIPDILDATTKKRETVISSSGRVSGVPNTNQAIESIPGAEGSKTGYTDLAGGNLGIVVDISLGRPVVIVVLGSTREGRFKDMSVLYNTLRKSVNSN